MQFLSPLSCISRAQQPCGARGYHIGQHIYIKVPSLQSNRAVLGPDYTPYSVARSSLTEWSLKLHFCIPHARHVVDTQYTVLH